MLDRSKTAPRLQNPSVSSPRPQDAKRAALGRVSSLPTAATKVSTPTAATKAATPPAAPSAARAASQSSDGGDEAEVQTPRALGSRARAASVDGQLEAEIAAETEAEVESMQVSQAALATREEQATAEEQLLAQAAAHASQLRSEAVGAKPQQSDAPHDAGAADGGGGSSPRGGGGAGGGADGSSSDEEGDETTKLYMHGADGQRIYYKESFQLLVESLQELRAANLAELTVERAFGFWRAEIEEAKFREAAAKMRAMVESSNFFVFLRLSLGGAFAYWQSRCSERRVRTESLERVSSR